MASATRLFTCEAANAFVPHLREIFAAVQDDLATARASVAALEEAGHPVPSGELVEEDPSASPEVRRRQRELLAAAERIAAAVEEVRALGAEVKAIDGLVDFRSRRGDEIVYLCWRYGEERVEHWHDLESGIAGRRPIDDPEKFEGDYLQ